MFFFIGGVQPKTVTLEDNLRTCPSCGLLQARLKRIDHYLSIFFIPVFRVKKGMPVVHCQSCGNMSSESGDPWFAHRQMKIDRCPFCGGSLESRFRYCPYCGKPL